MVAMDVLQVTGFFGMWDENEWARERQFETPKCQYNKHDAKNEYAARRLRRDLQFSSATSYPNSMNVATGGVTTKKGLDFPQFTIHTIPCVATFSSKHLLNAEPIERPHLC